MNRAIKIFITVFFILSYDNLFSQDIKLSNDSIITSFVEKLDSIRIQLYDTINKIKINYKANPACFHHNKYLCNIQKEGQSVLITHSEQKNVDGYYYQGTDTLINEFYNRIFYYNNNSDFHPLGEVIACYRYGVIDENKKDVRLIHKFINNEYIAKKLILIFMESPSHKKIITSYGYTDIAIDLTLYKGVAYMTMVTGGKKEIVNGKIIITKNNPTKL